MKRFITVLSGLLVLPAFAEVAPVFWDEAIEYNDEMLGDNEIVNDAEKTTATTTKNVSNRQTINRSGAASRAISATNATGTSRANTSTRAVASSPRTTTSARGTASRTARTATAARASANSATTVTSRNMQNAKNVTARVGTLNNSVMSGYRGTNTGTVTTLTDSGAPLYNSNTARIGVANRRASARLATPTTTSVDTTPIITEEDVATTTSNLTALAELTDYCKAQYAACMDNYCNVLDDNQGRCSCSKNLKNYAKTEAALAQASQDFQDTVQKIRYIGLTGPQIESLFAETEAEISMAKNTDNSRLRASLDATQKKIIDVSTQSASSYDTGLSWDVSGLLNADWTSGFSLESFLGTTNSGTSTVSNQRGEQLYKTATNRCRTAVLNSCVNQGINASVITNSYDLEIDKQCIAYERSLNEANTEMRNNVTNAKNILQQARLLLAQNKNSYDLRGCVAAIDSCMQDEYVCGSDYELCLDPTGKYLANGEIVKGGTPGVSGGQNKNPDNITSTTIDSWTSKGMYNLYSTWNYGDSNNTYNAWSVGKLENLGGYIDDALSQWKSIYKTSKDTTKTENMAIYLLQKIGYIDDSDTVHGMCASVMKQCQDYTFDSNKSNKKYIPANEVVRQYLNNTLAKIKVQQDAILSDYAEGCRSDVQSCLSTNGYDSSNTASTASKTAVNACAAEITTCMSVGGYQVQDGVKLTLRAMTDWVASMLIDCPVNTFVVDDGVGEILTSDNKSGGTPVACQSCPHYNVVNSITSEYLNDANKICRTKELSTSAGGQATRCNCPDGFTNGIIYVDNQKEYVCISSTNTVDDNVVCE